MSYAFRDALLNKPRNIKEKFTGAQQNLKVATSITDEFTTITIITTATIVVIIINTILMPAEITAQKQKKVCVC
jgi:hypothetical protein